MVETHQVQKGGVEVVNVDAVLHGLGPVIVGHAVSVAAADAAAGQPDGEGIGVVVAAGVFAFALGGRSAAEFAPEKEFRGRQGHISCFWV